MSLIQGGYTNLFFEFSTFSTFIDNSMLKNAFDTFGIDKKNLNKIESNKIN